jgi:protein-tyrosine phosphatase
LLLELPFEPITEDCVEEILKIRYSGYIVVLAHLERYVTMRGFKLLKEAIMENGILVQCNAESFIKGRFQRNALKLLKENVIDVIASDAHSIDERPPCLNEAYKKIEKKFGRETKNRLIENSERLFNKCL